MVHLGLQAAMLDVVRALPGENAESSSWDRLGTNRFPRVIVPNTFSFSTQFHFQLRVTVTLSPP